MVETYDPTQVLTVWNGIPIDSGAYAEGTFMTVARNNEAWNLSVGSGGGAARAKSGDRSGRVTLTLRQTSPVNALLNSASVADEATGDGVGKLLIKDLSGQDVVIGAQSWIVKPPDLERSNEVTGQEWIIECEVLEILVAGNALPA